MIKIPKKIKVLGRDILIEMSKDLVKSEDATGICRLREGKILLQVPDGTVQGQQELEIALLHEIMHVICGLMEYNEINNDEQKITAIGELLYQILPQIVERY